MLLTNSYTFSCSFQSISQCLYNNQPLYEYIYIIHLPRKKKRIKSTIKGMNFPPLYLIWEKSKIHPSGSCIDKNDVEK